MGWVEGDKWDRKGTIEAGWEVGGRGREGEGDEEMIGEVVSAGGVW